MNPHKREYFGGPRPAVRGVQRLEADDFKSLVGRYISTPFPLNYTRDAWFRLPVEDRNKLKHGPYLCAVSFKDPAGSRSDDNAQSLQMVTFDIDDAEVARDLFESPETVADGLAPYNFAMFTTANHTAENPRVRVVVSVKPCDLSHHHKVIAHCAERLGMPPRWKGSVETKTLSQPAFRPVSFLGEDPCAVLVTRTDGKDLDPSTLKELEPGEDDTSGRSYAHHSDPDNADVSWLLDLPLRGVSVADIEPMLDHLDPDIEYRPWLKIVTALKHHFRDEDEAREAYELFDRWSSNGMKYRGDKETWAKYKSFRPDAKGRRPVTIKSLIHMATEAGWKPEKLTTKLRVGFEEWANACEDSNALMREGVERIAEMPFDSEVVDEAMVILLKKRIASAGGGSIDKATLKKSIATLRRKTRIEDSAKGSTPAWMGPWCYISTENKFYSTTNGTQLIPEAYNRTFSEFLMSADDEDILTGRPKQQPADLALNVHKIPKVDGCVYDPTRGTDSYFTIGGLNYVNRYMPNSVPNEDPVHSTRAGNVIRKHLRKLVAEPEYRQVILDWMACMVQFPGRKIRWCPLLQSAEGAGKGLLLEFVAAAIGERNVFRVGPGVLASDYNSYAVGYQFVIIEELWIAGGMRQETLNRLKECITNDVVSLNIKYLNSGNVANVTNYFALTNHHNAAPLNEGDRRWMVIKSLLQSAAQKDEAMPQEWVNTCVDLFRNHAGAIRHYLMNREISAEFNPDGKAPPTIYHQEMVEESKNPLKVVIEDLIEEGGLIDQDVIHYTQLEVRCGYLARGNHKPSHFLLELGYQPWGLNKRHLIDGVRTTLWVHRTRYDEGMGTPEEIVRYRAEKLSERQRD
jgi:hypothetical protein